LKFNTGLSLKKGNKVNKVVWSHSSLKDYEGCARRYYEVKVLKNYKFKETQATMYGTELHKAAEDYNPCGWKDEAVWVRGIADLLIVDDDNLTAWVVDYKTGNNKYPDREQLKLMALMVFAHFPHIRKVNAALLFVVKNDLVKFSMTVDEKDPAWWDYRERIARIEQAYDTGVWNPRPSPLCPWCPVTTCEFQSRK